MAKEFHDKPFDDGTLVKLDIFQGYIRRWIPVFLTDRRQKRNQKVVDIFDFFAGPGVDKDGSPGSPRIVQEELKEFCETHSELKAEGIEVNLFFNDKSKRKIAELKKRLTEKACPKNCCHLNLSADPFSVSFEKRLPAMRVPGSANLVIMDQCGFKEVTPAVVGMLSQCRTTDLLFFVSSAFINRFAGEPAVQKYFHLSADELSKSAYNSIHRDVCDYFRSNLPDGVTYHLAPFSIKKGSNIHGVVFGSRSLFGLQKFLEVCWSLDSTTGEANYDIDEDPIRYGQLSLFPEDNTPKKEAAFQRELDELLSGTTAASPVDNLSLYRFTLEKGFLPEHARAYLKRLQKEGRLQVEAVGAAKPPRAGDFYMRWEHCRDKVRKVVAFSKD